MLSTPAIDTIGQLWEVRWFENVGKPITVPSNLQEKMTRCFSWKEAIKSCSSPSWENVKIEAANNVRSRLSSLSLSRFGQWNVVAAEIRPLVKELMDQRITGVASTENLPPSFVKAVRWDLIHLLLEAEYSDIVEPAFYVPLCNWYLEGFFPCGWEGLYPEGKLIIF